MSPVEAPSSGNGDVAGQAPSVDRRAFTDMVRGHDARLRGLAYKLLAGDRHRMDDVMQEAYLRAYRSWAGFRGEADPGSWLYRIVYNACIDDMRRSAHRPPPVDLAADDWEAPSGRPGPDRVVGARLEVLETLTRLPLEQRATIVLVDGEGFDANAAARLLGVAPGTVASRLSRARASLRSTLGKDRT